MATPAARMDLLFAPFRAVHPHHVTDPAAHAAAWEAACGDLPIEDLALALGVLLRTSRTFPLPADVRELVADSRGLLPPAPGVAWGLVLARPLHELHPLVADTVTALGGLTDLRADPRRTRWTFIEAYGPVWERTVRGTLAADRLDVPLAIAARCAPAAEPQEWGPPLSDEGDARHLTCGQVHRPGECALADDPLAASATGEYGLPLSATADGLAQVLSFDRTARDA